jgi:hypothetical protein
MIGGGPKRPWRFSLNPRQVGYLNNPFVILSSAKDLAVSRIEEMLQSPGFPSRAGSPIVQCSQER